MRGRYITWVLAASLIIAVLNGANTAEQPASDGQPAKDSTAALYEQVKKSTAGFKDITATAVVEYKNDEVLSKIGKKYAEPYELKRAMVRFKSPDKTRLEGSLGALKFTYITNREYSIIRIKPIGYEKKESIADKPHRRQGSVDLGLVTKDMWDDYLVAHAGVEGDGEAACVMLDLTRRDQNSNRHRIWVNAKKLCLEKMEKYGGDKTTMQMFYRYSEPVLVQDIWVPTKIEMLSPTGEVAGVTRVKDIKVNTGLEDTLFK